MKTFLIGILIIAFASCKTKPGNKQVIHNLPSKVLSASYSYKKTIIPVKQTDTLDDDIADQMADYYIVVTDTGADYYQLREKMLNIHQALNIAIDTMGRYYNKTKNLIALPDNDSDEIYAGDYFPRRYPTEFLSLEYFTFYNRSSPENTIALVAGIYENKSSADSALKVLKPLQSNAFAIKSSIYMGCMH